MSRELKTLSIIENYQVVVDSEKDETSTIKELLPNSCKIIETALKKQEQDQKKLKAFEIIKKKEVDVSCLLFDGLEEYNKFMRKDRIITPSEFDLLKEALL